MDVTLLGPSASIDRLREMKAALSTAVSKALNTSATGLLLSELFLIEDVVPLSASFTSDQDRFVDDVRNAQVIKEEIVRIGENLSKNILYTDDISEDSINDFFRDFLERLDCFEVKDQTRHGLSSNGSAAGKLISSCKDGREAAIIEGLKLSCVNTSYIGEHIRKATINYNPLGTPVFILAYVSTNDFEKFWLHCLEFLKATPLMREWKSQYSLKLLRMLPVGWRRLSSRVMASPSRFSLLRSSSLNELNRLAQLLEVIRQYQRGTFSFVYIYPAISFIER